MKLILLRCNKHILEIKTVKPKLINLCPRVCVCVYLSNSKLFCPYTISKQNN